MLLLLFAANNVSAKSIAVSKKIKPTHLRGKWQLAQTFASGALHTINKSEYDGIMYFGAIHKYYEEVYYESMHWIIKGKWHFDRKKGVLLLHDRVYVLGKTEDHPQNILLTVFESSKKSWAGSSTDKGQLVKVFYVRIHHHCKRPRIG
jgi:hypothetical protein